MNIHDFVSRANCLECALKEVRCAMLPGPERDKALLEADDYTADGRPRDGDLYRVCVDRDELRVWVEVIAEALGTDPAPFLTGAGDLAVMEEVCGELMRATTKFPTWPTDALHAVGVVAEEMGELQKEVLQLTYEPHKSSPEAVRKEAVQLAAMAFRFLGSLARYTYTPGAQHEQNL